MPLASSPIGVFDSGVGGLSVLRALLAALPHERFVYLADSAHAPYGERGDPYVSARTHAITDYLCEHHAIKALVVACNTATAAAIHEVRHSHPELPLVGLEPAIKPALTATRTGHVGVIGTRGTLTSAKFSRLLSSVAGQADFVVQPCDGLAHAIERSAALPVALTAQPLEATETGRLCKTYLEAMGSFGGAPGQIDTLVLGCTHYVFVADELRAITGPDVRFIETGEPVARQTQRLLDAAGLANRPVLEHAEDVGASGSGASAFVQDAACLQAGQPGGPACEQERLTKDTLARVQLLTTGAVEMLQSAARRWLGLPGECCKRVSVPSDLTPR